ncbi:hypothetical protein EC968_005839 [Mortierella alpina]|nr:hypothetical protein EC968_005839 [Mortierella alpina]
MSPPMLPDPWTGEDYGDGFPPTLLAELAIMAASNAIREKPNWWLKYNDPAIAARWRQELGDASLARGGGYVLRSEQIDYVFKEVEWHAEKRQQQIDSGVEAPIEVAIDGTRRSDGLISQELKSRLLACVKKLKDVPDHLKDWHPGSNKQVLDLVHPSLFPVIAGRTMVTEEEAIPPLDFVGQGKVLKELPLPHAHGIYCSEKYQWLPTDFDVSQEGNVKIKSYINNLHPVEHKDSYPVLGEIFEKFLPMFEEVLGDMRQLDKNKQFRLTADPYSWYDNEPEFEDDDAWQEYHDTRVPNPVKVPEFTPMKESERYNLKTDYPLQVICKLADIELTPDNPKYEGGVWHVEGMANENIVASGIYYYHTENISESRLNFRIQVCEPDYEQNDNRGMELMYGLENDQALIQYLDGIVTKQDRCIAFPNIYQHQVQPFELEDPTKPGTRSILVFFLVDPAKPILSTTNVPPQQKTWAPTKGLLQEVQEKMPPEIFAEIHKLVDWPINLDEAKLHREELMKERKYFVQTMNTDMFERPFSLCEH